LGVHTKLVTCEGIYTVHRLRVFENRVLRRIFGPKREDVAEGRRKLHNEELHNLYTPLDIIRVTRPKSMRWVGHVAGK
jgi:hypothetical protein